MWTAGCSQNLWYWDYKKLPTLLLVRGPWASTVSKWGVREPPQEDKDSAVRGTGVKEEVPAIMIVGWIWSLKRCMNLMYTLSTNGNLLFLFWASSFLSFVPHNAKETLRYISPITTSSETYTDTFIRTRFFFKNPSWHKSLFGYSLMHLIKICNPQNWARFLIAHYLVIVDCEWTF